jgi:dihydroorotase-like cyclic amidohydrolase
LESCLGSDHGTGGRTHPLNSAKVFGLYPRKGALVPGADADVVIVDPDREAVVDDRFYHCVCETSVYGGYRFRGMARTTVVRGRVMMDEFETVGTPGWGRYVPRGADAGRRS